MYEFIDTIEKQLIIIIIEKTNPHGCMHVTTPYMIVHELFFGSFGFFCSTAVLRVFTRYMTIDVFVVHMCSCVKSDIMVLLEVY